MPLSDSERSNRKRWKARAATFTTKWKLSDPCTLPQFLAAQLRNNYAVSKWSPGIISDMKAELKRQYEHSAGSRWPVGGLLSIWRSLGGPG